MLVQLNKPRCRFTAIITSTLPTLKRPAALTPLNAPLDFLTVMAMTLILLASKLYFVFVMSPICIYPFVVFMSPIPFFLPVLLPLIVLVLLVNLRHHFKFNTSYVHSVEEKPVEQSAEFLDILKKFEAALWKTKHIPATALMATFLSARGKHAKVAALLGLWQLYSATPPSEAVKEFFANRVLDCIDAGVWIQGLLMRFTDHKEVEVAHIEEPVNEHGEVVDRQDNPHGDLFEDMKFEPGWLEKHRGLLSFAALFVSLLALIIPAGVIYGSKERKTIAETIVDLGKGVTAKTVILKDLQNNKDTLLNALWTICGGSYVPDKDLPAKAVQEECVTLLKQLAEYETLLKVDFYGVMREEPIARIEKALRRVEKMYSDLSALQKGEYNLNTVLQQIKTSFESLNDRRASLLINVTGKQKPVVLHLVGQVGLGKTVFARNLVEKLSKKFDISSYWRTTRDEFWSNFAGQQILVWDDIGVLKDGKDYDEFCYHTETAPSTSIGADIKAKGKPTNPLFIVTTGNVKYLGPQGHNLVTVDAYHRRRDIVIEMSNPAATKSLMEKGKTMQSWEFDPTQTTFTLFRSVPTGGSTDSGNRIGETTEDMIFEHMCALKTINDNEFKRSLRNKAYLVGAVPEDEKEDRVKASQAWLIGDAVERPCSEHSSANSEYVIKEKEVECKGYAPYYTASEGRNRCFINAVITQIDPEIKSSTIEKVVGRVPIWYPAISDDNVYMEEYNASFHLDKKGDQYAVANVAAHFKHNLCLHRKVEGKCVLYDMGFKDTVHVSHDSAAGHYEGMAKMQMAVIPESTKSTPKTPVFVFSGPSGSGKTHMAQTFAAQLGEPITVDINDVTNSASLFRTVNNRTVLIDDITMSSEDYEKATKLANDYMVEEGPKPRALIFTENSDKMAIVRSPTTITELHRRSHLVTVGFVWSWFGYFRSYVSQARRYQAALDATEDKESVMRTHVWAEILEYSKTVPEPIANVPDVVPLCVTLAGKKYSDVVKTTSVWTLPMPNEVDFSVDLKIPLREFYEASIGDLLKSLIREDLYAVSNRSGRFSKSGAMNILQGIFRDGPRIPLNTMEEMVMAFNNANIHVKTTIPGVAVLRGKEGSAGICWRDNNIRMFLIGTIDGLELNSGKIDVESYFGASTVYSELVNQMTFDPNTINDVEKAFADLSLKKFTEDNIVSTLLDVFLVVFSIGLQIYAPLMLANNVIDECKDRMELDYYRRSYPALKRWKDSQDLAFVPFQVGETQLLCLEDVEEFVIKGGSIPLERAPGLSALLSHVPTGFATLRSVLSLEIPGYPIVEDAASRVHFPPHLYMNSNPTVSTKIVNKVLEEGSVKSMKSTKSTSPSTASDYCDSKQPAYDAAGGKYEVHLADHDLDGQYNSTHDRNYYNDQTYDDAAFDRACDWSEQHGEVDYDEVIEWESSGSKKAYVFRHETLESSADSGKKKNAAKVLKSESSADSGKKQDAKKILRTEAMESDIILFTSEDSDIAKVRAVKPPATHDLYYAYVDSHGYYGYQGQSPNIRCLLYSYIKAKKFTWAIMFAKRGLTSFDALAVLNVEGNAGFEAGDVVMIKRTLAMHSYEHYGIVGPNPTGPGLSVYHVQGVRDQTQHGIIAVDPLDNEKWILANRDKIATSEPLKIYANFDHLKDFAFKKFVYNVNASNCETWALAMRYSNWQQLYRQVVPAGFEAFCSIVKTFSPDAVVPPPINALVAPTEESSIDPGGLNFNRCTILPATVILLDPVTKTPVVRGLGIKGNYVLSVAHAKPVLLMRKETSQGPQHYNVVRVWHNEVKDVGIYEVKDPKHQQFKDITNNFLTQKDLTTILAEGSDQVALLTIPTPLPKTSVMQTYAVRIRGHINQLSEHGLEYVSTLVGAFADSAFTQLGDCGSPITLLSTTVPGKIVGVHRAATAKRMYAAVLSKEQLLSVLDGLVRRESENVGIQCWTPRDGVEPAGGICPMTGFPIVGRSIYVPNPVRGTKLRRVDIAPACLPVDGEPAILAGRDPRANGYQPVYTTLEAFKREAVRIDIEKLRRTTSSLVEYFSQRMTGKYLEVLSVVEALNGPSRVKYPVAGSMERSTSPGFPLTFRDRTSTKNPYLEQVDFGDQPLWKIANNAEGKELQRDVDNMGAIIGRGLRPNVVFSYFPKDEVLPMKKITTPKTRGILASNIPYVIWFRRYFLSLHLRFQEMFNVLPVKIGIDCLSTDWNELAQYHLKIGDKGFDADAKSWDASIPVEFMRMALEFCNQMYMKLDPNCTEQDNRIRAALHMCVEKPYVLVGRDVLQLPQGQVSGQPGTAFENSIVNILLIVQCYIDIMNVYEPKLASVQAFFENCALSVYGDDMMITLSDSVKNIFTVDVYANQAAEYGFTITNAHKTADIGSACQPLTKLSFLKRSFKRIRTSWAGPIELSSIGKSVAWIKCNGSYFPNMNEDGTLNWRVSIDLALIRMNFERSLRELCLHDEALFYRYLEEVNRALLCEEESPITADIRGIQRMIGIL